MTGGLVAGNQPHPRTPRTIGQERHRAGGAGGGAMGSAALAAQLCTGSYCPSVLWQLEVLYDSLPMSPER